MAMKMSEWRKHPRDMDELLRYDSEDGHQSIDINIDVVAGSQSSCSSVPGTPHSLTSDSVPETSNGFDFDTDVDCPLILNINQMMMKPKWSAALKMTWDSGLQTKGMCVENEPFMCGKKSQIFIYFHKMNLVSPLIFLCSVWFLLQCSHLINK